ncbi:MAG: T9SS type A sorting domain-containing protein [Lewinellaceae bacterium]|nr:T9SS type A sorting domain-containing protein [Lewinellaceae bacterium]
MFYLEPFTHEDIDFPDDITIDCAGCGSAPGVRPCDLPAGHNVPYAGGYPLIANPQNINVVGCGTSGGLCNLGTSYTDIRIDICAGTFKILRHWIVLDWCTNETWTHDQLIKVVDDEGPVISCPADMTVSTNPSQCCATVDLPNVIVEDRCSPTASISAMIQVYEQYPTGPDGDDLDTDPDPLVIATYTLNKTTNPGQFKLETFQGNNFWDCDTLGNYGTTPCLPIGHHLVTYMAQDVCGNTNAETFWLTVVDDVPPVATCTEFTTVAIGTDDPTDCYAPSGDCKFGGVTWIPASAFNQGSYDNCNDIAFTVRRMKADTGYSDCIEDLKNAPGCDNWRVGACGELDYDENNGFNDEYDIATAENDSIKFYCCEVGTTQLIILRVYQLDINGNWAYYTDENGLPLLDPESNCIQYIYNECMIDVEVQDKIKPLCQAPPHVTVSCENFEPSLWAYGYPSVSDNCCLDDTPPTSAAPGGVANIPAGTTAIPGVCGATQKTYYNGFLNAGFDTTCNRGIIIRRFTAWDCYGQSSSCTQRITVTSVPDYNIVFPADDTENCVGVPDFGYPQITNDEGCELIGVAYNDVYFTVVPDACYKIERTWRVINWCDYDPDAACFEQLRANGRSVRVWNNPAIAGDETPNCVTYKQIIKVIDQTPPTITCTPIDTCDYSSNFDTDGLRYWNDGDLWWDNGTQSHNLCETDKTLMSVSAEDFCDSISPVGGLRFRYLLFLDLDADGIMETVVSSADAATRPFGRVRYNNYQNPNYGGGNLRRFDLGSNPYAFNIEQTLTGARVIWRTASGATQDPNLPHGRHKIKWIAEDGCGNEAVCEEFFTIRDCKAPTVACADVNINLMFGGMATLWTSDFFLYAEDNCTPADILKVAVIRQDDPDFDHTSFPAGSPQSIVVTCADQGTNVPVEVWVIDAAGRADFCTAYVNVQANLVGCNTPATATVAGALATENEQGVEDASVELAISSSGGQGVLTDQSDVTGSFQFPNAVPMSGDYTLTPTKDDNPLNGVTTYDLLLISKHILGLEPLTTPYKMIAADANRSGSITTFDIVEFRKLILGIYEELPTNTSWRFVDKTFPFPNPANPFQSTFPENISAQNVQSSQLAEDFVGVKVGDVNGTVTPNSLVSIDDRTAATMLFDIQDRAVKAGEVFTVNFKGAERVQGYQFTMNFNGLEVMDILPGTDMKLDNFGVFGDAITTSVDGAANEFAVTFRATKAGQISQMLGVSGRITKAEGYSLTNDRLDIAFRFNNGNTSTISGVGFELYQNQPNPFVNKTFIGFHLPEAANATLRIFDATGRMVFTQNGDFAKGYNTFAIDRQLLNTTGVLYYTVETTTDSATKKMIQSK